MINVEKFNNATDEPCYAIKFSGTKRQFNTYMKIVGSIIDKTYDFKRNAWIFKEQQYAILQALIDKAIPKKTSPVSSPGVLVSANKVICDYDNIGINMKLPPYTYQKEAIKFGLDTLSSLQVLPCGSGKTVIGIGLYIEAIGQDIIKGPGVIVVKAALKTQWAKEIEKFSNFKPMIIQTSKDITSAIRAKITRRKARVKRLLLANADAMLIKKMETEIVLLEKEANQVFKEQFTKADLLILNYETLNDTKVRFELHKIKPQFFFADEIHYIKDSESTRSKSLCEFSAAKIKVGATATPIKRDPRDVYGIFKFINPTIFPNKNEFERSFLKWAGYGRVIGGKNEKLLNSKISPFMIVKNKEEVSKQLPRLVVIQRHCDLEPEQAGMTDLLKSEIEELKKKEMSLRNGLFIGDTDSNAEILRLEALILARQTFAQQLANSEELLKQSKSELAKNYITGSNDNKMVLLIELMEEILESGEKVCVFSRFVKMQDIITDRIQKEAKRKNSVFKGLKLAYVNGSLSDRRRYEEVYDKFRDSDEYKILLMSDAGAEGINLSNCKYIIETEFAESYAIQTQRHGRVERADSIHDTVFVYQLIANDSFDEIAQKIVNKKERYDNDLIHQAGLGGDCQEK